MLTSHLHSQVIRKPTRTGRRIALILLALSALFFALYKSNSPYTSDEVWSVRTASLSYHSEMAALKADVHPPLYFQILFAWVRAFGTGERVVRSLSGLFYVLSLFAVYGLARELYGKKTALLTAALYLSSPLAIVSAQFARMYSLLSLLSILSTWLYLQFSVKPRKSRMLLALYIGVNILGTFTHIAFFFLLFGQIVFHLLFFRKEMLARFVTAVEISLVPYLVLWAPILFRQIVTSTEGLAWVQKPGLSSALELVLMYGGAFLLLMPVVVYLWWRSGFASVRQFSKLSIRSLPLWLLVITIATPLLISQWKPIFNPRLAIVGLHLFALTIGALVGDRSTYFLAILLTVLSIVGIVFLHPGSSPCDNRAVATYLGRSANDGDVVIFTSLTRLPVDYYLEQSPVRKKLYETSFPAGIDRHPGHEGRISDPSRKTQLEQEALELVDRIAAMRSQGRAQRIFVFKGRHPEIDSILAESLRRRLGLAPNEAMRCDETSPYFKQVSIYH